MKNRKLPTDLDLEKRPARSKAPKAGKDAARDTAGEKDDDKKAKAAALAYEKTSAPRGGALQIGSGGCEGP